VLRIVIKSFSASCRKKIRLRIFRNRAPAFTLVELLVVVSIIGLLAALAVPVTQKAIAAGKTGKASSNLKQIGTLINTYASENGNRLPRLKEQSIGDSPENYRFFQNYLRLNAGIAYNADEWKKKKDHSYWLPDIFYDPTIKKELNHQWGSFGANNAFMLEAGDRFPDGTPLAAINPLSGKVLVASAKPPSKGLSKKEWYFEGKQFVIRGTNSSYNQPDPRFGGKALCLFADGHVEALEIGKMDSSERERYFIQDMSWNQY